jgi:hypothetical protein
MRHGGAWYGELSGTAPKAPVLTSRAEAIIQSFTCLGEMRRHTATGLVKDCRWRLNGNMRLEAAWNKSFTLGETSCGLTDNISAISGRVNSLNAIPQKMDIREPARSTLSPLMDMDCPLCQEILGNGAQIGSVGTFM